MYLEFFGLSSSPFSIAPDPSFLYLTAKHEEALAHLLYSTSQKGGFIMLTGEIGTGKTTLCRHFLKLVPEQYQTAFIFNPKISSAELLATVCDEFGIERPSGEASIKQLTDLINARLLEIHATGRNALLVIDEAQNLSMEVLEQIRLLTNLETTEHKLLQIILIGQPQLRTLLARDELQQLSQRIVARYHLEPLSAQEAARYIGHRLATAGARPEAAAAMFPRAALKEVFARTQGVPRLINVLCDRALLGAYVENRRVVSRSIVRNAAREAFGDALPPSRRRAPSDWRLGALAAAVLAVSGGLLWHFLPSATPSLPELLANKPERPVVARAEAAVPAESAADFSAGAEPAAFRDLFRLWDVPGEIDKIPGNEKEACEFALRYRLRCLSATNKSWHQFRQYNLPAVLTLRDVDQHEFHAVIESASDDQASLRVDGKSVTLSLRQLAFYWTGKFTLLWRPLPGYLSDGQLSQKSLAGLMSAPPSWLFGLLGTDENAGAPLHQLVAGFQRKAGIQADGVIGMQTMVMLSREAGNAPLLGGKR